MATSIDGRIVAEGWPESAAMRREYEAVHNTYGADAWMYGRITMEPFAGAVRSDAEVRRKHAGSPREDHVAPGAHESFAVAIDPSGRLAWNKNDMKGNARRADSEQLGGFRRYGRDDARKLPRRVGHHL